MLDYETYHRARNICVGALLLHVEIPQMLCMKSVAPISGAVYPTTNCVKHSRCWSSHLLKILFLLCDPV